MQENSMSKPFSTENRALIQGLYSLKFRSINAPLFEDLVAQARADVFFSLLFGNTVVSPGEAFFDSAAAIKIFGEIFSVIEPEFCRDHGWSPLILRIETPTAATDLRALLKKRWSDQRQFLLLFREDDASFDSEVAKNARRLAQEFIDEAAPKEQLATAFARLSDPYRVPLRGLSLYDPPEALVGATMTTPSLVSSETAGHINRIINHCQKTGAVELTPPPLFREHIGGFSLAAALSTRLTSLNEENGMQEISELAKDFFSKYRNEVPMGQFMDTGPEQFGKHFERVRNWLESDWHGKRALAHDAAAWINTRESTVTMPEIANERIFYLSETRGRDFMTLDKALFRLDWTVLKSIVSDTKWKIIIQDIRNAQASNNVDELVGLAENLLNFFAKKLSEYFVQSEHGLVKLTGRAMTTASALPGVVAAISGYSFQDFLTMLFGGVAIHALIKSPIVKDFAAGPSVSFIASGLANKTGGSLKRTVVHRDYLGKH